MNKIILVFDPFITSDFENMPTCLIFNNHDDAKDWFEKRDFSYEVTYDNLSLREVFIIVRYKYQKLTGICMKGKAFI